MTPPKPKASAQPAPADGAPDAPPAGDDHGVEIGGPRGPEPTRYHDWEVKGRCSDF
nr:succinate dehydrogenase assembly factor 4 [Roseospira visakhapatnamensis]